jgi:hypothetical protein
MSRSPESLARDAISLYWRVKSHGLSGAMPDERKVEVESDAASIAQEIFDSLSRRRQEEVMRRVRELEELPNSSSARPFGSEVAKPPGVSEAIWLSYLTISSQEEALRLRVLAPVPWQLLKAIHSEGLVIHPDFEELSPWSAREFGERIMGWRKTEAEDWPDRHSRSMLRAAYRRLGRYLFWRPGNGYQVCVKK